MGTYFLSKMSTDSHVSSESSEAAVAMTTQGTMGMFQLCIQNQRPMLIVIGVTGILVGFFITRLVSWWCGNSEEEPELDFPSKEEPAPLTEIRVEPTDELHLSQTEILPMEAQVQNGHPCDHVKATSAI